MWVNVGEYGWAGGGGWRVPGVEGEQETAAMIWQGAVCAKSCVRASYVLAPLKEASGSVGNEVMVALVGRPVEGLFLLLGPAALHRAERTVHQVQLGHMEEPSRRGDDNVEVKGETEDGHIGKHCEGWVSIRRPQR